MTLELTVTDTVAGIATVEYSITQGATTTAWTAMNLTSGNYPVGLWNATLDTTQLQNGSATINIRATDCAGNVGTTSRTVIIDNAPPVITITAPATAGPFAGNLGAGIERDGIRVGRRDGGVFHHPGRHNNGLDGDGAGERRHK